jgi:WD40 repeat protein/DNA-binding SARP family transcriptional activator
MLQIRLLGQFDIRADGKRVTIPTRAAQSLLAYLVLTAGTSQRREKLAGMLWPESTEENARKNLRQELWRIRKAISTRHSSKNDYLIADEMTLKFNREAEYWLDVAQMERPDLDFQSLIANLSLYQGELLPGFYDEWITLERERVNAVFDARMEQLLEQLITAERWIAVQEWGERWLTLSGVREPAYRALMLASGVRGDMAKVASLYQRCTDELLEYLGVEPSSETRALYNGLLKGTKVPLHTVAAQPSGTITFLFTDIEGSTRLLEKLGNQYPVALSDHHEILRASIQKWNGREMDTQGDAFFVTFTRAIDAVQCAAEAQRALASHAWPEGESLRVRMGLHTGEPLISSTGYVGMDVHRAARLGDAGHGGQILLSQTTRELIIQDLPEGMAIRDLGEHRLKDMKYPTPIYQLVVDGLPLEFPPLRTKFTGIEAPTPGAAPFKGLQFFDVEDSELFFGRETLTAKLMKCLHEANFLSVIIGASGSGKSSLVRAGVVPALKKGVKLINGTRPPEGSADWQVHIITPTAHPLEALAIELTRDSESVTVAATLVDDLSKDPRSLYFFLSRRTQIDSSSHTLLVIDQFEELFTLCRDEFEREAFIDNLLTALTPPSVPLGEARRGEGNITLIITLRADFYAHLAQYPELRDAVARQQEYIGPMTTEELRRAMEEPARRGHWDFEPGLVDLILRDIGDEPGALPLLSHALLETWKRRAGHVLTLKGYAEAGGVHGAIANTAESLYQTFSPDEQTIVRNIMLRLTEFGEGTEDTRRRATFHELMSQSQDAEERSEVRAVLNRLAQARLVTLSEETAEVSHEALIREWPRLREWLSEDREGIILHRRLTETAQEWELLERDTGSLYRGARLVQANEWFALNPHALNAQERMFLEESNEQAKQEEQEREEQRQRELASAKELAETQRQSASRLRIRNRVITTIGSIALILALLAGTFGLRSNQNAISAQNNAATAQVAKDHALNAQATAQAEQERAENEKQLATSRELAIAAVSNLEVDAERSILLALQALSTAHTVEAESALHSAVQASRVQLTLDHGTEVRGVSYSPDGTRLATASGDATVKIWDGSTGQELLSFSASGAGFLIGPIKFSPDGTRLASAHDDNTARIWDATTGEELLALKGHTDVLTAIAWNQDGTRLATAGWDNTAKVWDAATGKELLTLSGHTDVLLYVSFSADGTRLVTGSGDSTAKVWDLATGKELFTLAGPLQMRALWSPDGTRIVTDSGGNYPLKVWDPATGHELLSLYSAKNTILGEIAFSPDGTRLVKALHDGTVIVWDATTGEELLTFPAHLNAINDVAFHPDGIHLATAGRDGMVKVWDISPQGSREWLTLTTFTGAGLTGDIAVYSPDGTRLATSGPDNTAIIWDAATGAELVTLAGHTDTVWSLAFSPDGSRLATSSRDLTARVWDATSGKELLTLSEAGHGDGGFGAGFRGIMAVAFSPDGKWLATAGADGTAIMWDATTGQSLLTLSNYGLTNQLIAIPSLAFSPDGARLITTSDNDANNDNATSKMWDLTTGRELFTVTLPHRAWEAAFSPDGRRLVIGGHFGVAKVLDAATGQALLNLSGHTSTVLHVAFSPDGSTVATASSDGTAKLWDTITGTELLTLTGHGGGVAFSPDGTRLVTGGADGTARVYLLRLEELIALAKSRVTRSLTPEECQKYLHLKQCPPEP